MKLVRISLIAPLLALLLAMFGGLSSVTSLRAQSLDDRSNHTAVPMVTDWSHRHLIFSHTQAHIHSDSPKDQQLQADRRFQQQVARRYALARSWAAPTPVEVSPPSQPTPSDPKAPASEGGLSKVWTS